MGARIPARQNVAFICSLPNQSCKPPVSTEPPCTVHGAFVAWRIGFPVMLRAPSIADGTGQGVRGVRRILSRTPTDPSSRSARAVPSGRRMATGSSSPVLSGPYPGLTGRQFVVTRSFPGTRGGRCRARAPCKAGTLAGYARLRALPREGFGDKTSRIFGTTAISLISPARCTVSRTQADPHTGIRSSFRQQEIVAMAFQTPITQGRVGTDSRPRLRPAGDSARVRVGPGTDLRAFRQPHARLSDRCIPVLGGPEGFRRQT